MFKVVEGRNSFFESNMYGIELLLFCSQTQILEAYGYTEGLKELRP
jgi:hypothetical protein